MSILAAAGLVEVKIAFVPLISDTSAGFPVPAQKGVRRIRPNELGTNERRRAEQQVDRIFRDLTKE